MTFLTDLHGPRGFDGPPGKQGIPAAGAVPTAEAVGAYFDSETPASAAGDRRWARARDVVAVGAGIDPTGGANSSAAFQALLRQAQAQNGTLVVPAGTYIVNDVSTLESFNQPRIVGAGMRQTIIRCTLGSGHAAITFVGGSGQVSGGLISDATVENPGGTGIELRGVIGVTPRNVRFVNSAVGLLFHNKDAGSFTEFCVANECYFETSVARAIEYRITSGNNSFHGSGFRAAVINQPEGAAVPSIKIGEGALVYNAPWDGVFFGHTAGVSLAKNHSTYTAAVYGHLGFEVGLSQAIVDETSASSVYYGGSISRLGDGVRRGKKFALVTDVAHNSDGGVRSFPGFKEVIYPLTPGATVTESFPSGGAAMASVTIVGPNFTHNHLIYVYVDPFSASGTAVQVAKGWTFNNAGWADCTFSVSNGRLVITNATIPASGVTARIGITHLSGSNAFPLI